MSDLIVNAEDVIRQTYQIILSCDHRYSSSSTFTKCMEKHVQDVVKKSIQYVKKNPSQLQKCKTYTMVLVVNSLHECAQESYHSETILRDIIKCIKSNVKDLISVAVNSLVLAIQLSTFVKNI